MVGARVSGLTVFEEVELDEHGSFLLPKTSERKRLQLHAWSEGWRVFSWGANCDVGTPDAVIRVPPRQVRRMRFVDAATGNGVPNVRAVLNPRYDPILGAAPRSDADGSVSVLFANEDPAVRLPHEACLIAEGFAEHSIQKISWRKGDPLETERSMRPGVTVRGRIRIGNQPVSSLPLLLEASIGTSDGGSRFGVEPRVFRTAKDGGFTIPGRVGEYPFRVVAALSPGLRAKLSADDPRSPPVAEFAILAAERPGEPHDIGEVRLDRLRSVDVTIRGGDGAPPGSVSVLLMPLIPLDPLRQVTRSRPHVPVRVHTDRRGRSRVLVGDADRIFVFAADSEGAGWAVVDADDTAVNIRLDPRHRVGFRVTDEDGSPLADHSAGYVTMARGAVEIPSDVLSVARDMASALAFPTKYSRTDENGIVTLIVPFLDIGYDFVVSSRDRKRARFHVRVPADREGPVEVRATLRAR